MIDELRLCFAAAEAGQINGVQATCVGEQIRAAEERLKQLRQRAEAERARAEAESNALLDSLETVVKVRRKHANAHFSISTQSLATSCESHLHAVQSCACN